MRYALTVSFIFQSQYSNNPGSQFSCMKFRSYCLFVVLVCTAVLLAGCTGSPATPAPSGAATTAPAGTPASPTASATDNLVPSPTDALPDQNKVSVIVKEKDYAAKIPIEFDGGMGQIHVKKIDVTVYLANGDVKTGTIPPNKGASVEIEGTKQTDRVVVYITFDNGDYKKTNDVLSPYRSRG